MDIMDSSRVRVQLDMEEVSNVSVDLLSLLEEDGISGGLGIASLALSLGRLLSPKVLTEEDEIKFTQALMEFAGLYWTGGGIC